MNKGYKTAKKLTFLFLLALLLLFSSSSIVIGAYIAGEKDIIPTATEAEKKGRDSLTDDALIKTTAPGKETENKTVQKAITLQGINEKIPVKTKPDNRHVTIDFDNVDIEIFIKFISELTGKNFIIDKGVKGKVTIISPTAVSVEEAYKVFESVLEVYGYTTVPAGSIIKIIPAGHARSKSIETRLREEAVMSEDKVITQIIPLDYANPDELKKLFAPLISKNSVIVSYPFAKILIVTDVVSNIKRLLRIIKEIDVGGIGGKISVIALEHAIASTLAKTLPTIFQRPSARTRKDPFNSPVTKIAADERTNSLIIFASKDNMIKIKKLIKELDKKIQRGSGNIHVYYLENANAEDLAQVLSTLPSNDMAGDKKGKIPVISKGVRIIADNATNSLVITADKADYLILEDVIKKLDIPRRMVYIEALIMEVNVNKDFKLGVEWSGLEDVTYSGKDGAFFGGSGGLGNYGNTQGLSIGSMPTGFSLGIVGEAITIGKVVFPNLAAILQVYQKDSDVHVLSTPQILTTDNEEAEIIVGKNMPYTTRKETSDAKLDYTTYEYKDVGVSLKITPQISRDRFVRLKIFQEVSRLIEGIGDNKHTPTTFKRSAQTTVIIKDANTIVIGGLIGDDMSNIDYKVPCLGSIPLLGWFFKSNSKKRDRTNLFIFLTPHIIENSVEAKEVYQEKKDQIDQIKRDVLKMEGGSKDIGIEAAP